MDSLDEMVIHDAGPNVAVSGESANNAPDSDDNMVEANNPGKVDPVVALL